MTPEQRLNASVDLTLTYFQSYYAEWRLTKVLTNKKLLEERYDFYSGISKEVRKWDDQDGEATIAQEIKHGLYFDSIAQCVQYVEDLFALIRAARKPDYFIRNIITYKAGEVTNAIKQFKASPESLSQAFHFPTDLPFNSAEDKSDHDRGVDLLVKMVGDLVKFYKDYWFFYNQYKHGLAVAMRPLGNVFTPEQIEDEKRERREPHYLVVYDNFNIKAAAKKGTFDTKHGIFMPGFTENVRPLIPELQKHNNFLRFVFPADLPGFSYEILVDIAYKAKACINTFIANYSHKIKPEEKGVRKFQLPEDYRKNNFITCTYSAPG